MTQSTELWRHRKTWFVIVAAAVLLAIADSGQTSLIRLALGQPAAWTRILLRDLAFWLTFVAWMPAVLFLAHTFRLAWPVPLRRVLIHIIGGSSFALVQIASATLLDPMRSRTPNAFRLQFLQWVTRYSALDFLAYWAVVAAFYTIHYYQESRHREIAAARLEDEPDRGTPAGAPRAAQSALSVQHAERHLGSRSKRRTESRARNVEPAQPAPPDLT